MPLIEKVKMRLPSLETPMAGSNEWKATCPFCPVPGRRKKLYINFKSRKWHCWKCNNGGDIFKLLGMLPEISIVPIPVIVPVEKPVSTETFDGAIKNFHPIDTSDKMGKLAYVYLKDKRRLDDETILKYHLMYAKGGLYDKMIIIPVYKDGEWVNFQTRRFIGYGMKNRTMYKGSGRYDLKQLVYNLDIARQHKEVTLVENPFSVMRIGDNSIASFGKSITKSQMHAIFAAKFDIINIAYDTDALDDSIKVGQMLRSRSKIHIVKVDKDPDDYTHDEIVEIIKTKKDRLEALANGRKRMLRTFLRRNR